MARTWEPLLPCSDCGEMVKQLNRRMPQIFQSLAVVTTRVISATPDASPETTTVDGYASTWTNTGTSWGDIRTGAGNQAVDNATVLFVEIKCDDAVDKWGNCARTITGFDLSDIPSDATITSVELELNARVTAANDDFTEGALVLIEATLASNTAVAAGDFDNFGTVELATRILTTTWRERGQNVFYLNESGLELVQSKVGGVLNLGFKIGRDFDNDEPTWASGGKQNFTFNASEGTSYKPATLIVTYQE